MSSRFDISLWVDGHLASSQYGRTRSLGCQCYALNMALYRICYSVLGLYLDNIIRRVYCNYLDWRFYYVQSKALRELFRVFNMALYRICYSLLGLYLDNILRRVYCNYLDWRFYYVQSKALHDLFSCLNNLSLVM